MARLRWSRETREPMGFDVRYVNTGATRLSAECEIELKEQKLVTCSNLNLIVIK